MPYVTNDSVRIHFEVEGDGPALVLQHGFGDSLSCWRDCGYTAELGRMRRLVLVDARGHGASDAPHDAAAYTMERRVGDVLAVLDALGTERADFMGYSMGGWIGFGLLEHARHRLRSAILGGAHPYAQSMELYRRAVERDTAGWVGAIEAALGTTMPEPARTRFLSSDVRALQACVARDRDDGSAALRSVETPCLLIAGDADPAHDLARRWAVEAPSASFVSLAGLNHFEGLLRGDLVLPHVTRFLSAVSAESPDCHGLFTTS